MNHSERNMDDQRTKGKSAPEKARRSVLRKGVWLTVSHLGEVKKDEKRMKAFDFANVLIMEDILSDVSANN